VASPENAALTAGCAAAGNTWHDDARHAACVPESVMMPGSKVCAGLPDKNLRLSLRSSVLNVLFSFQITS